MRVVIWILEDNKNLGFLLQTALSGLIAEVEVRRFETGMDALLAVGVPDIIFADTHLAGNLTGPQVVEILRERHPDIAAVLSASLGGPLGITMGPRDRMLPKPFSLVAVVNQVKLMIAEIPRLQVPPPHAHRHLRGFKRR